MLRLRERIALREKSDDRATLPAAVVPLLDSVGFAAFLFGSFAYQLPEHWWVAAIGCTLSFAFAAVLHRGILLDRAGIVWYVLHPRFAYRRVPWPAVRGMRKGLFGFGRYVYLDVEPGRYEPVLWGTSRNPVVITPRDLVDGDELLGAIELYRLQAAEAVMS